MHNLLLKGGLQDSIALLNLRMFESGSSGNIIASEICNFLIHLVQLNTRVKMPVNQKITYLKISNLHLFFKRLIHNSVVRLAVFSNLHFIHLKLIIMTALLSIALVASFLGFAAASFVFFKMIFKKNSK